MGVGGADLLSGTGELTALGSVFAESYKDLQRCSSDVVSDSSRSTGPTPSPVAAVNASDVVAGEFRLSTRLGPCVAIQTVSTPI